MVTMSTLRLLAVVLACGLLLGASRSTAAPYRSAVFVPSDAGATPAASTNYFRWADDSPKLTDDKAAHFGMGFTLGYLSLHAVAPETASQRSLVMATNVSFWLLWEVKDGFLSWESCGPIGGDGFSVWDLAYSVAGAALAFTLY